MSTRLQLDGLTFAALLADKAFDADAVIPAKRNRRNPAPHDREAYNHRFTVIVHRA